MNYERTILWRCCFCHQINREHDSWFMMNHWMLISGFQILRQPEIARPLPYGTQVSIPDPKSLQMFGFNIHCQVTSSPFQPDNHRFFFNNRINYGQLDLAKSRKGFCHSCDFKVSDPHFQGPLRPSNTERDHAFWLRENSLTSSQPSQSSPSQPSSSSSNNQLHCVQLT